MWKILLILFILTAETLLFTSFNVLISTSNPYPRKRDQDRMDKYGFEITHELRPVCHFERSRSKFNRTRISYYNGSTTCYQLERKVHVGELLFISGDIEMNPGPVREPCNNCRKTVAKNQLTCESCDKHYHIKCSGITPRHFKEIKQTAQATWTCPACLNTVIEQNIIGIDPSENIDSTINACEDLRAKVQETHLTDRIDDCELHIDGYEIKRSDRKDREGVGVAIYFEDNLNIVEKYHRENIEAIWVELSLCSQKMLIGTIYRPPDRDDFYTLFPPELEQIWQTRKNLLIIGDLNSDLTPNGMNDKGRRLKTILNNYNLKNMIKDPTSVTETTKTVLDLVIVNDASKLVISGVQDICIADHKLVYVKYTLKRSKETPKEG
eukprot:gene4167-20353_t